MDEWINTRRVLAASRDQREGENPMKSASIFPILAVLAVSGMAQNAATGSGGSSPAKSIGLFAYPKNQQNADQQLKDETDCYSSAKQQTAVDPQAPPPAAPSAEEQKAAEEQAAKQAAGSTPKGGAVKGSAKGAAGGAAIGAIAGDAGTGAAIGATAGAVRGRRQQKKAQKTAEQQAAQQTAQAQQQAQGNANAQYQGALDTFKRAFSACMDARGYSVK
jgi:Glycine-zipper domain